MTLHIQECADLAESEVLSISQGDQLIEGAKQVVGISHNLPLVQALAGAGDNLGEQVEGVNVLEDVGLAVGDEHHVELVEWLVDEAHIVLLDGRVLRAAVGEFGERGEEGFDAGAWHLPKLSGEDSFPSTGAYRSCEDDLQKGGVN